jgi:MerR family redox-sensitive transcriptional activator SoxR
MALLSISDVARRAGMRPSAIRYYEEAGVLPAPRRVSGQRRYDDGVLEWLAVVRAAQSSGFTLAEIRGLLFGFRRGTPLGARWRKVASAKIEELDAKLREIQAMKELLQRLQANCRCETVQQCGASLLRHCAPAETRVG